MQWHIQQVRERLLRLCVDIDIVMDTPGTETFNNAIFSLVSQLTVNKHNYMQLNVNKDIQSPLLRALKMLHDLC